METNQKKQIDNIKQLVTANFKTIRPDENRKDIYTAQLDVGGYLDLLFTIANLIKVSIVSIDADSPYSKEIPDPRSNVQNILEIALQLLPYEEAEFLDKLRNMILEDKDLNL